MQDERVLANINTVIFIFNANHDSVILGVANVTY